MWQQGQLFRLSTRGPDGNQLWAYRYRVDGRGSKRVQREGFATEDDAQQALDRALERLRRRHGTQRALTLARLVDEYLAQHDAEPETTAKLRWLLSKSVGRFGNRRLNDLDPREIPAWRMTLPEGHRFKATQALRQVLARASVWKLIDNNPATLGVDNPAPTRTEKRPFESWDELHALAVQVGPRHGPLVIFVRRAHRNGRAGS